jgi:membrane-bound serine protease (ClpP class)
MRLRPLLWVMLVIALAAGFLPGKTVHSAAFQDGDPVVRLTLDGALHPAMLEYLKRAQQEAMRSGAQAIILQLNTPGGEIGLMNRIIEQMRGSDVPIIVYVAPRGAMAGSAGAILTMAGHVAAMAPETIIGAASPVGGEGEDIGETMSSKIREAMKANVRTLMVSRPPDAIELAEQMIDNARAVSVEEALEVGLIDIRAGSIGDLLNQLDGREVQVQDQTVTLRTAGATVIEVEKTFLEDLLMVLANPNIAFILLAIGVQAILIEFSSPGGWIAGFIGVVCLLLATYGMGLLPVNWFGILFLVVAFVLFVLDIQAPTHGALTAAGVGSFIVGALVLFNSPNVPEFQRVSVPLVVGTGLALGLMFFSILGFALRAQKSPVRMGRESIIGQVGVVNTALHPVGTVQIGSELWTAVLEEGDSAKPGDQVQVTAIDNLRVRVRKVEG